MNNYEFLSFIKTPQEKHVGIATIRVEKRWILRYKIAQNPKGEGYFTNAPSIKIDDSYYPAFACDSSYETDEIKKFVLQNVKSQLSQAFRPPENPPVYQEPDQNVQFNFDQPPF